MKIIKRTAFENSGEGIPEWARKQMDELAIPNASNDTMQVSYNSDKRIVIRWYGKMFLNKPQESTTATPTIGSASTTNYSYESKDHIPVGYDILVALTKQESDKIIDFIKENIVKDKHTTLGGIRPF